MSDALFYEEQAVRDSRKTRAVEALTLKMSVHPYAHDSMSLKQQQSSPGLIVAARSFEVRGGMFILVVKKRLSGNRDLEFLSKRDSLAAAQPVPTTCRVGRCKKGTVTLVETCAELFGTMSALRGAGNAVVLSRADFDRIRTSALSLSATKAAKPESAPVETARQRKARLRTERMLATEAERTARIPMTRMERRDAQKREDLLVKANRQRNEDLDDAKKMRAMMNYAVAVTIRDEQVKEKKKRDELNRLKEKRLDHMMEIARLEAIHRQRTTDEAKASLRAKDALVIQAQIEARAEARRQKLRDQQTEQEAMAARRAMLDAQDREAEDARKANAKRMLDAVLEDNRNQIAYKKALRQKEIDEDLAIEAWQRAQDAKEAERERVQAEKEAKKAALQKQMLDSQVRAMDNLDQIEHLRMRRAFEAQERKQRAIELEKARQQAAFQKDLKRNHRLQHRAKERLDRQQKVAARARWEKDNAAQKASLMATKRQQERTHVENAHHVRILQEQIDAKSTMRRTARTNFHKMGAETNRVMKQSMQRVEDLKVSRIAELKARGVPEKYLSELINFDPSKAISQDYKRGK